MITLTRVYGNKKYKWSEKNIQNKALINTHSFQISGSCLVAVLVMPLFGITGLIGFLSKFIGPITIVPIMTLLTISAVPDYIIGIAIGWFICFILTITNAIPQNSPARTDQNSSIETLKSTPWIHVPIPGQYGTPTIDVSLLCGFIASSFVAMIESIGDYNLCAKLSKQGKIPESNLNRGFVVEGIGCMLSSSFGIGTGITTYAENIAIMSVTKVSSRITMQVAGLFLLVAGIFSKFSAVLAMIPEPVVGGVLAIGICMVNGVMLRNLMTVDLRLSRNLTIMGISIIMGLTVALHFENNPLNTGNQTVDNVFGTLLTIRMLIGGIISFTLDNITPGIHFKRNTIRETIQVQQENNEDSEDQMKMKKMELKWRTMDTLCLLT
uniref:Permease n=1 Tax=Caenorhabditis tropicalis TaxID=1561998 RepID=A0A1I7TE08_9PELO